MLSRGRVNTCCAYGALALNAGLQRACDAARAETIQSGAAVISVCGEDIDESLALALQTTGRNRARVEAVNLAREEMGRGVGDGSQNFWNSSRP